MTIAEGLRDYFKLCPILADGVIHFEYLPDNAKYKNGAEWALSFDPSREVVTSFMDGEEERVLPFSIDMVQQVGPDEARAIETTGFADALDDWLDEQQPMHLPGNLPILPALRTAESVSIIGSTYVRSMVANVGRYSTQFELRYTKKKKGAFHG